MALVGNLAVVPFTFTAVGTTTPADPDTVQVIHRKPDLTETVYEFGVDDEVEKTDVGDYTFTVQLVDHRRHYFRAVGTGDVDSPAETFLDVEESHYLDPLPD